MDSSPDEVVLPERFPALLAEGHWGIVLRQKATLQQVTNSYPGRSARLPMDQEMRCDRRRRARHRRPDSRSQNFPDRC
jgi:hypothetical protein